MMSKHAPASHGDGAGARQSVPDMGREPNSERNAMSDADNEMWMRCVLRGWREGWKMWRVMRNFVAYYGEEDNKYKVVEALPCGAHVELKSDASAWLADWYRPVSDALFAGATDEEACKLWRKTRRERANYVEQYQRRNAQRKSRGEMAARTRAFGVWAKGWRAKHDWKVTK